MNQNETRLMVSRIVDVQECLIQNSCDLKYENSNYLLSTTRFKVLTDVNPLASAGDRGSIPGRQKRIFTLISVSRTALGPTQPPLHWVPGVLSPVVKRGRGVTLTTHPI
jgi:hypothetical protein